MYSHLAFRGSDIRILSILAPGVYRPNFVPLNIQNMLNEVYFNVGR